VTAKADFWSGDGDATTERYFGLPQMGRRSNSGGTKIKEMGLGGGTEVMESGMRAGESYKIWHARDTDGTLDSEWEKVIVRGARVTGVEREYLGGVVEQLERRLK
jgi:hypothetical protein